MYVDKPMRGHGLMQATARVNRVFGDKPGGLVVDYLGLAHELKRALATYTESGGTGETALDKEQAVQVMLEKYEVCCGLFHGFDRAAWTNGSPAERLQLLPAALEHVLAQEDGKARCLKAVRELSQAFALEVLHPETGPYPRRRVAVPARPGGAVEAGRPRREVRRGAGSYGEADRLAGRGPGRRARHFRRGRAEETGGVGPVGGLPAGSARHAPEATSAQRPMALRRSDWSAARPPTDGPIGVVPSSPALACVDIDAHDGAPVEPRRQMATDALGDPLAEVDTP